jgi:hypothetical protein
MRHRIVPTVLALALAVSFAPLAGCKGSTAIESLWPAAAAERVVPKPAGTPRWPLTGLEAPSPEATQIRVVSVKIENSPEARPQTGLDKADIVYETVTEGGITRFNALFQSQNPILAGPVRSARPSDFSIVPQYHALFAHCGADSQVRAKLTDRSLFDDMDQFFNPGPYSRAKDRPAPHNLYVNLAALRTAAVRNRGYAATETIDGLAFARSSSTASSTVGSVTVLFSSSNKATWKFEAGSGLYARSINGKPHLDKVSHKQLTARNVVVLWARVTNYVKGSHGQVVDIELTGSGRASVFRDGQRFDGTWEASATTPPRLSAADGSSIRLDPGNTWFQVIGTGQSISMK